MAQRTGLYLAVYDISANSERDAVAEVLEGVGVRVQESVFELRLNKGGKERLLATLRTLPLETGYLFLYRVDEKSARKVIGKAPENPLAEERHAFVV